MLVLWSTLWWLSEVVYKRIQPMAVWSIYKSGSSTIYIYSQEVRILQNELKVKNGLFQEVRKFLTSKNVFYMFKTTFTST